MKEFDLLKNPDDLTKFKISFNTCPVEDLQTIEDNFEEEEKEENYTAEQKELFNPIFAEII